MSTEALLAYERGTRKPRPEIAQRIEAATNGEIRATDLLGLSSVSTVCEEPAAFAPEPTVAITVPEQLLILAKEYNLDIASLITEGGVHRLKQELKDSFNQRNHAAINANRKHIADHGTFGERMGVWQNR